MKTYTKHSYIYIEKVILSLLRSPLKVLLWFLSSLASHSSSHFSLSSFLVSLTRYIVSLSSSPALLPHLLSLFPHLLSCLPSISLTLPSSFVLFSDLCHSFLISRLSSHYFIFFSLFPHLLSLPPQNLSLFLCLINFFSQLLSRSALLSERALFFMTIVLYYNNNFLN